MLKIQLLQRLRYILEVVCPSPETVLDILEILIRIARHSVSAATQVNFDQVLKVFIVLCVLCLTHQIECTCVKEYTLFLLLKKSTIFIDCNNPNYTFLSV